MTALALLLASAWAGEPREFKLAPRLAIDGEVLSTEKDGFRVRVEQGVIFVPFDAMEDMRDLASLDEVDPTQWTVLIVGDPEATSLVSAAFGAIPNVDVAVPQRIPDDERRARALSCGDNLTCLSALREPGEWWFLVRATHAGSTLQIDGMLPWRRAEVSWSVVAGSAIDAWQVARASIGLEPDEAVPDAYSAAFPALVEALRARAPEPKDEPDEPEAPPGAWTQRRVAAWSFVPVPGLPSLMRKDYGGFGGALASTIALSAGWVGVSGATTTRRGEFIALATVGSYLSCVSSNQLFGSLGLKRQAAGVSVGPTLGPDGVDGVHVGVTWVDVPRR